MIAFAVAAHVPPALAVTNTWNGTAGPNWETAGSWSLGHVPLPTEDVVVPQSTPNITVNGTEKVIKSLNVANEVLLLTPRIQSTLPGAAVQFTATDNVYIGTSCRVSSAGAIVIRAGGDVSTLFLLQAGPGAPGSKGAPGFSVEISGRNVSVSAATGGAGGTSSGSGIRSGSGGDVVIDARQAATVGILGGGNGGGGAIPGSAGNVLVRAVSQLTLTPAGTANTVVGNRIQFETDAGGQLVLTGLATQEIHARTGVCLSAGSLSGNIDLRGDDPDAIFSDAGRIRLHGNPLLDSGVTLAQLTNPDGVITTTPCDATVPVASGGSLTAVAALLLGGGLLALRRGRGTVHSAIAP